MNHRPEQYLLWVVGACLLGFVIPAVFAGILRLTRSVFLVPYAVLVGLYLYAYTVWSPVNVRDELRHHWLWGLIGAIVIGAFVVKNVLSQPASAHSSGTALVFDLLWLGIVYGTLDAMLLTVLPVHAVWRAFSEFAWSNAWAGRLAIGGVALVASLLVTIAYHAGYPELRGPLMKYPLIGNGTMTIAYLATSNPVSSVPSHVAMHVTAVLHGPETAYQLPPHY